MKMHIPFPKLVLIGIACLLLAGCGASPDPAACTLTEPAWLTPPEDDAVQGEPAPAYYYANADQSILAGAWWWNEAGHRLPFDEQGTKIGWFRPEGAELTLTGRRLDGDAPPLETRIPCCYPTRFQSSGLDFPTPGCWEITATAADSELTFTILVE